MASTGRSVINTRLRLEGVEKPVRQMFRKRSVRRRVIRYGLLAGNVLLLALVGFFVMRGSDSGSGLQKPPLAASALAAGDNQPANPLDQLSSADIALSVARVANLPEKVAVTQQAISENAELAVAQSGGGLAAMPQVVTTELKSNKDIQSYVVQSGETVASIAAKFRVTSDSILWSNNLASDTVNAGQKLLIPPVGVNGIVYTVKAGDTADSLAAKYRTSAEKITTYNDAEIGGLKVGSVIIIPDGQIVKQVVPVIRSGGSSSFPWGGGPVYNGANAYDYGYCTWYVASRIAVPSNWGNANTWDNLAPRSGWVVTTAPSVGAIAQTDRGAFGHVAIVTDVSPDGTQIKYADMNGLAGWGRVGYSDWTSVSRFEHYITH